MSDRAPQQRLGAGLGAGLHRETAPQGRAAPPRPLLRGASRAERRPPGRAERLPGRPRAGETAGERRESRGPPGTAGGERSCGRGGRRWPGPARCRARRSGEGLRAAMSAGRGVGCALKEERAGERTVRGRVSEALSAPAALGRQRRPGPGQSGARGLVEPHRGHQALAPGRAGMFLQGWRR